MKDRIGGDTSDLRTSSPTKHWRVRRAEVTSEPALKRTGYHWLKDSSRWTRKVATSRGHKSQPIGVRLLS